jgi:hypothetical protein
MHLVWSFSAGLAGSKTLQLNDLHTENNILKKEASNLTQDFENATGKQLNDITQKDLYLPGITPELRAKYRELICDSLKKTGM